MNIHFICLFKMRMVDYNMLFFYNFGYFLDSGVYHVYLNVMITFYLSIFPMKMLIHSGRFVFKRYFLQKKNKHF
jgi:hypothetical protein